MHVVEEHDWTMESLAVAWMYLYAQDQPFNGGRRSVFADRIFNGRNVWTYNR